MIKMYLIIGKNHRLLQQFRENVVVLRYILESLKLQALLVNGDVDVVINYF